MAYWRTYYHAVWSTKERQPRIDDVVEPELFASMTAAAQRLGAYVHAVSGTADHVHMVVSVPPTVALATLIGQVKGASAHLMNRRKGLEPALTWEEGYGLFTLGSRQLGSAVDYVRNQKTHHAQNTTSAPLERTSAE